MRVRGYPRWLLRLRDLRAYLEGALYVPWRRLPPAAGAAVGAAMAEARAGEAASLSERAWEGEEALAAGAMAVAGLSTLELGALLSRLVERMAQVSGAATAAILLLDEDEGTLRPGAYYGLAAAEAKDFRVPLGQGFGGRVAAERRPLALLDVQEDATLLNPHLRRQGVRSMLGVPLLVGDRLLGVAHVDHLDVHDFSPRETRRLQGMAAQAALAIHHAQLHEQLAAANRQLAAANQRLATIIANIPAGVAIFEAPSGRAVSANQAAESLWGHPLVPEAGLAELPVAYGLYRPNGELMAWEESPVARSLRQGETVLGEETLLRRRDGKEYLVLASSAPLLGSDGNIEGAVAIFQDTSGMELEKVKDEFVAVTAHELFTPLTIIKGTAQLLARKLVRADCDDELAAGLRLIDGRANWMTYLIQKMIDAAELQLGPLPLRYGWVDLVALAKGAARRFQATTDKHQIVVLSEHERLLGFWDKERLDRVFANLVENAVKYSPNGGRIEIEIVRSEGRNPLAPLATADGRAWALVRVSDQGVGIPREQQAHLFRRFYRAGSERYQETAGLGLGLYICNRYVAIHGGQMHLDSEVGKGSTFYFSLPLECAAAGNGTATMACGD